MNRSVDQANSGIKKYCKTFVSMFINTLLRLIFSIPESIWGEFLSDKTVCMIAEQNDGSLRHYDVHNLYGWSQTEPTLRYHYKGIVKHFLISLNTRLITFDHSTATIELTVEITCCPFNKFGGFFWKRNIIC